MPYADLTLVDQPSSVAQWLEHPPRKWKVLGSNPGWVITFQSGADQRIRQSASSLSLADVPRPYKVSRYHGGALWCLSMVILVNFSQSNL